MSAKIADGANADDVFYLISISQLDFDKERNENHAYGSNMEFSVRPWDLLRY